MSYLLTPCKFLLMKHNLFQIFIPIFRALLAFYAFRRILPIHPEYRGLCQKIWDDIFSVLPLAFAFMLAWGSSAGKELGTEEWQQQGGKTESHAKNSGALPDSDITCSTRKLNQKNYHLSLHSPNTAVIKRAYSELVSVAAAPVGVDVSSRKWQEYLLQGFEGETKSWRAVVKSTL